MAKKDVTAIMSGVGWIAGFADKLIKALRERGVSDEQIHQLVTENGDVSVEKTADTLAEIMQSVKSVVHIFVDYTKPLSEMIKVCCGCGHNDPIITEKHFFINRRPNGKVKMKFFSIKDLFGEIRSVNLDEVVKAMAKEGYRVAELPEGLACVKASPDEQRRYLIVLLGSVWQHWDGSRHVPYLCYGGHGWQLRLCLDGGERGNVRFLAVCKS